MCCAFAFADAHGDPPTSWVPVNLDLHCLRYWEQKILEVERCAECIKIYERLKQSVHICNERLYRRGMCRIRHYDYEKHLYIVHSSLLYSAQKYISFKIGPHFLIILHDSGYTFIRNEILIFKTRHLKLTGIKFMYNFAFLFYFFI